MKPTHLGCGIVVFENAVKTTNEFVHEYVAVLRAVNAELRVHYAESADGTSKNLGGYEFSDESMKTAPERFIETLPQLSPDKHINFIADCEEKLYLAAIEYCRIFPAATEAITWRIRGHIATYKPGQFIGCHSDAAVPAPIGQPIHNQSPIHNTLTAAVVLTDDYEGGELYFPMWDISVKPPAGSIVLYPSSFIGAHEVLPVTAGERVSYLQWFCHGYLSTGMPPLTEDRFYDMYKWLPNLKDDVGREFLYQKKVI